MRMPPLLPSLPLFLALSLALLLLPPRPASAVSSPPFSLGFFPAAIAQLALSGGATANATSGAVSMPSPAARVQYRTLIAAGPILAGFRTSSGNCTLFTWAFRAAPNRQMHSLPLNPADLLTTPPPERVARARAPGPDRRYTSPWGAALSLLLAAAAGAMLTFILLFLWYSVAKRRPVAPVEFPMRPSHVVYEKIVLVGGTKDDAALADPAGNK